MIVFPFVKSLDWRAKNRVNTIREDFLSPEVILIYQPVAPIGYDKLGNTCKYCLFLL
jgi:hypothetical protein